ncbi:hypothetical protein [Serratia sp. Se-RSBMAAmG]|uniref:hypothetical protein n=1 Tax=Serratia sp. Se-RSBMAAmG TaxID=3043305 RepID=UPI0024AF4316|nr:hypothetical protein [Serratia sp. Se-RSBMAAmG]MDI6976087.1 hypothetical protein [Serratia sp. Se-RSBMAAmG]
MFFYLIVVNFLVAASVSLVVISFFSKSINNIVNRIIDDPINISWAKYTKFAGMVVGISSGIRVYDVEKYISPVMYGKDGNKALELTTERWFLEVYRTVIETLQGLAWMMLVFFVVSLLAYVIVRWAEIKYKNQKNV